MASEEESRFTSDRRVPSDSSWAGESDWIAGTSENVEVVDGGLVGRASKYDRELLNGLVYDFENNSTEDWAYATTDSSSSSWGVKTVAAPDGGGYGIYVTQNSGGGNSARIYSGPVGYDWAQSYDFEFLVKSDNFDPSDAWLGSSMGWRGKPKESDAIGLSLHNTDPNGNLNPFTFRGDGVSNSTSHDVDWKPDTWYWVKGYCDEKNGTAQAKIWADGSGEPSSYQVSADITTGVSNGDVHVRVNGDNSTKLDCVVCHVRFG